MQYRTCERAWRERRRWMVPPEVIAVEPDDPILLLDAAGGDDVDRRDALRPTLMDEIVLVADDLD